MSALTVQSSPSGLTPAPTAVFVQPKLREMVEPVIPGKVLDDLRKPLEVLADLTIRADGSVADVKLLPPVPRQTQRYLIDALLRWRFEPLPGQLLYRVQLVINEP